MLSQGGFKGGGGGGGARGAAAPWPAALGVRNWREVGNFCVLYETENCKI